MSCSSCLGQAGHSDPEISRAAEEKNSALDLLGLPVPRAFIS